MKKTLLITGFYYPSDTVNEDTRYFVTIWGCDNIHSFQFITGIEFCGDYNSLLDRCYEIYCSYFHEKRDGNIVQLDNLVNIKNLPDE